MFFFFLQTRITRVLPSESDKSTSNYQEFSLTREESHELIRRIVPIDVEASRRKSAERQLGCLARDRAAERVISGRSPRWKYLSQAARARQNQENRISRRVTAIRSRATVRATIIPDPRPVRAASTFRLIEEVIRRNCFLRL